MVISSPGSIFRFDLKVRFAFRSKLTREFGQQLWLTIEARPKSPRFPIPSIRNEFESRMAQTRRISVGVKQFERKSSTIGLTTSDIFRVMISQSFRSSRLSSSNCSASHFRPFSDSFSKRDRKTVNHLPGVWTFDKFVRKISHSILLCRSLKSQFSEQSNDPHPFLHSGKYKKIFWINGLVTLNWLSFCMKLVFVDLKLKMET